MSTPQKLRGGSDSELTKFKKLWPALSAEAQGFWESLFASDATQADIRSQLRTKLKVSLTRDSQLNRFRAWLLEQAMRADEADRMEQDEADFTKQFGQTMTKDQIRELVLGASYRRSLATGDFKQGLATMREDVRVQRISLARDQFELDYCEKLLDKATREAVERIAGSNLSNADKIAAMRQEVFKSVDELEKSGKVVIPKL